MAILSIGQIVVPLWKSFRGLEIQRKIRHQTNDCSREFYGWSNSKEKCAYAKSNVVHLTIVLFMTILENCF